MNYSLLPRAEERLLVNLPHPRPPPQVAQRAISKVRHPVERQAMTQPAPMVQGRQHLDIDLDIAYVPYI